MDKKTEKHLAVVVMAIALFILGGLLITTIFKEQKNISISVCIVQEISSSPIKQVNTMNAAEDNELSATEQITPYITPQPSSPTISLIEDNLPIAQITFYTYKKTKTYDVMADVDEDTLKKNIGHLPSSAWFGEEGLCVLMGHRDTDFSILQYIDIEDTILIDTVDNKYKYKVVNIEIVDSDELLKFDVMNGRYLILVTCYPFEYVGHAPQKYIVYCQYI